MWKREGELESRSFLDLSGDDPRRRFASSLIRSCGKRGPILVYNRGFEAMVLNDLARLFPDWSDALAGIGDRLVDLLPLMRGHYYHPDMRGSWSLKAVLPTVAPDMVHADLGEVADGQAAQSAYLEAIAPSTDPARRAALKSALQGYCALDTGGLAAIVQTLSEDT
jgi:hypothetical protein